NRCVAESITMAKSAGHEVGHVLGIRRGALMDDAARGSAIRQSDMRTVKRVCARPLKDRGCGQYRDGEIKVITKPQTVPPGLASRRLPGVRITFTAAIAEYGRAAWVAILLLGGVTPAMGAQEAVPLPPCSDWLCEEFKIFVTALDSVQVMRVSRCSQSPIA